MLTEVTPEKFKTLEGDDLVYVGRIRTTTYFWEHDNDYLKNNCINSNKSQMRSFAEKLGIDFLVLQNQNDEDLKWAKNHLANSKLNSDDEIHVAVAEVYRDSNQMRKTVYILEKHLEQIMPQLDCLGKIVGESWDIQPRGLVKKAELNLLFNATEKGIDYVVLIDSGFHEVRERMLGKFAEAEGIAYKLKKSELKSKKIIEVALPSIPHKVDLVKPVMVSDSSKIKYATDLLDGASGGTVLDWKK